LGRLTAFALGAGMFARVNAAPPIYDDKYPSFAEACIAAGTVSTLVVTKSWTGVNRVVSTSCAANLWFVTGGLLELAPNIKLTLSGNIAALGEQQIFDASAKGAAIILTQPGIVAHASWWGAKGDKTTLSGNAFNAALSSGSGNVTVSCGVYLLGSTTVTIPTGVDFVTSKCAVFRYSGADAAFLLFRPHRQNVTIVVERTVNANKIPPDPTSWPGGGDKSSVGVKVVSGQNNVFDFTVSNFYQGVLITTANYDFTNNVFLHIEAMDNKIGLHLQPTMQNGTNQNTFLSSHIVINSGAGCTSPPTQGTKYIWLDKGSDNNNTFINSNVEGHCPQYSLYIDGSLNAFYAPRLEDYVNHSVTFAPGSEANVLFWPLLDGGRIAPVIQDLSAPGNMNRVITAFETQEGGITSSEQSKLFGVLAAGAIFIGKSGGDLGTIPNVTGFGSGGHGILVKGSSIAAGLITVGPLGGSSGQLDVGAIPGVHYLICQASNTTTHTVLAQGQPMNTRVLFFGTMHAGDLIAYSCQAF
jgi:hypothetical protein